MFLPLFLLSACPVNPEGDVADDTAQTPDTAGDSGTAESADPVCTEPTEVGCVDEIILDLSLHDDMVSDGNVENEVDGDDWLSVADASAGGMSGASQNPWLYLRFTDEGLQRVDIDDESALEEMTWHFAARRYILRLNGGTSGPSCVGGAEVRGDYAEVTLSDADGAAFALEDFYTDECELIEDGSTLSGSIEAVLGAWWEYGSCVATTGQAFVLQLDDGRFVKFAVDAYYKGEGQTECNDEGITNNESGIYTFRWQFLE